MTGVVCMMWIMPWHSWHIGVSIVWNHSSQSSQDTKTSIKLSPPSSVCLVTLSELWHVPLSPLCSAIISQRQHLLIIQTNNCHIYYCVVVVVLQKVFVSVIISRTLLYDLLHFITLLLKWRCLVWQNCKRKISLWELSTKLF